MPVTERALLLFLRRAVRSECNTDLAVDLHDRLEELVNALQGPLFTCSMLAGTVCDDICDWEQLTTQRHEFSQGAVLDYRLLFCMNAQNETDPVRVGYHSDIGWRSPSLCTNFLVALHPSVPDRFLCRLQPMPRTDGPLSA